MTEISYLPGIRPVQNAQTTSAKTDETPRETGVIDPARDKAMRAAAEALEASFLSEMLKGAGLGKTRESFGGGTGEDQFSSFLRDAQAQEMVKSGGIGLAESLYQALKERENGS